MRADAPHRTTALVLVGVLGLSGCSTFIDQGTDRGDARATSSHHRVATDSGGARRSHTARPSPPEPSPSVTAGTPTLSPSPTPTRRPEPRQADAVTRRIPDQQWQRMVATGTWRPECPVSRSGLRVVHVNFVDFSGDVQRGTLVVNKDVAESISRVFTALFEHRFPIRRMRPVEHYRGDSNASLADDNTSAFNCRRPTQINAPVLKSPHANGRAIDINPVENPWTDLRCKCWFPGREHRQRTPGQGKILKGGMVWRTFRAEGWIWQDIDVPDYMHFDTGYPSRHYRGPAANKRAQQRKQSDGHS